MFQWENVENRLRFDRIMVTSLWPLFLAHPVCNAGAQWKLREHRICYDDCEFVTVVTELRQVGQLVAHRRRRPPNYTAEPSQLRQPWQRPGQCPGTKRHL